MFKKITYLLLVSLIGLGTLAGCGTNELDTFVEDFNQSARKYDATKLMKDEFGEIETEDEEESRNLFKSKEYSIDALYDKKNIVGYFVKVNSDQTSIDKTGKGYNAVLTLADSLKLDTSELEEGMQEAFNDDSYEYEDGDYKIKISVINITAAVMFITLEKK